ncbi:MAG: DNA-directed RNA polymerase specialized sigma subunit [Candidatus Promineifilaceae bacterium]|jgi:DNA-directed RNA polymerase specialized sigma subunit
MKIPLNMSGAQGPEAAKSQRNQALESKILAAKRGDWDAKSALGRSFLPLITSLAEKRSSDISEINTFIAAGKEGLFAAARKYKRDIGPVDFQLFALDFIEAHMDKPGKSGGFFGKLFKK